MIFIYYLTVLVIVQKVRKMTKNIQRYCTVGYRTVPCAPILLHCLVVFFQVTGKVEKVKLDSKSLIRYFGVKYCCIFFTRYLYFLGSSKCSTTRKNIYRLLHRKCEVRIFIHELQNFGKRTSERSKLHIAIL